MTSHQVQLLFADLALILFLARALGHLFERLRQPPVVGEILAGILLGPTLLHTAVTGALFPAEIRSLLTGMADVGVALFMFAVGLEVERAALRGRGLTTAWAALGSTLVPFTLGLTVAVYLLRGHQVGHHAAAVVFVGLSLSVTAFPVLARILTDRGLSGTDLGGIAIATAAVVDIAAWIGLAAVQAAVGGGGGHWRVALMVPYAVLMLLAVRPVLRWLLVTRPRDQAADTDRLSQPAFIMVLIAALLSGAATEAMDMHFIFGAFLFGAVMPREGAVVLRAEIRERTGQVTSLLLPVYFVVAGLNVDLSRINSAELAQLGVILLVAMVGKFGGTYFGARARGLPPRPASALAVLMNTRGLTELVILGVGLQLGLLDGRLYSLMVVMAVVTTAMTGPLLSRVYAKPVEVPRDARVREREPEPAAAK
jgi:Kef-type K+ transport system membrane component KefB